ncbi:MAG: radical SAM protein, partial [Lachnospiraceae bacterium]|nr:radical SAM protein [Lachnospiraceae bacterium]
MTTTKESEISSDKHYLFPSNIEIIEYKGKWIVVSVQTANWIVLENIAQYEFFQLLLKFSLGEALSKFNGNDEDAEWVVVQLEARQFEKKEVLFKQAESSAHIYLTNGCNMRCPHCYMFAGEKNIDELSQSEILLVIEELCRAGIKSVVFSGGEPLLKSGFKEYVKLAADSGAKVEVLSNGTLWTTELIEELSPCLSKVQISIDGFDEDSNAKIRGKGNFEKSIRTVNDLLKHNVPVSVVSVP